MDERAGGPPPAIRGTQTTLAPLMDVTASPLPELREVFGVVSGNNFWQFETFCGDGRAAVPKPQRRSCARRNPYR